MEAEQIKNIEKRLSDLEHINRKKVINQKILLLLFGIIIILMILFASFNENIGSFAKERSIITEGNKTTTIVNLVKIENNKDKIRYLRDSTYIYYGFFLLLFLILILISFDNGRYKAIEDE